MNIKEIKEYIEFELFLEEQQDLIKFIISCMVKKFKAKEKHWKNTYNNIIKR